MFGSPSIRMPKLFLVLTEFFICGCFACYWLAKCECLSDAVHSVPRWQLFVSIKCVFCAVLADSSNLPCRSTQTSNKSHRMRRDGEERAYWEQQNRRRALLALPAPLSGVKTCAKSEHAKQTRCVLYSRAHFRVNIMRIACTCVIMYVLGAVACPSEAEVWCVCGPYVWVLIACGFVCLRGR